MTPPEPTLAHITRRLIEAMAKHLPPSAAGLRLLDVNGRTGAVLLVERPDLVITTADADALSALPADSFDAIAAFDVPLDHRFLRDARRLLRAGGRLITIDSERDPDQSMVGALESAGYTRILVEMGAECPLPVGTLARGEQPHDTDDTLARVAIAADRDPRVTLENFSGRALHLLIHQTPNLPPWKLSPETPIIWRAASYGRDDAPLDDTALLAFTSLPSAVAFMQQAVLRGIVYDVNKVARFQRAVALTWDMPVLLNPSIEAVLDGAITWTPIDRAQADQPEE
ncbi:MAG: hypothetical protein SGJ24_05610 [Chloroflexota bacterium]|nr:hypothetical protein [Chloroflexota bacterium]